MFSFAKVALGMVLLHSSRTVTKRDTWSLYRFVENKWELVIPKGTALQQMDEVRKVWWTVGLTRERTSLSSGSLLINMQSPAR